MKQSVRVGSEQQARQFQSAADMVNAESTSDFVDNRPGNIALRQLKDTIRSSPKIIAQRNRMEQFRNSSRMIVQRTEPGYTKSPAPRMHDGTEYELLQGKFGAVQRIEDEEPLQGKFAIEPPAQRERQSAVKPNNTGLPDNLKSGIESLSGISMDSVRVHYNSPQPAQLNALAYAQGTDIHVAPGQERHLPHEAWHVVQQAQGRVTPTMQMKDGVPINDDKSLEHEADVMGEKAIHLKLAKFNPSFTPPMNAAAAKVTQRLTGVEMELHVPFYGDRKGNEASNKYFVPAVVDPIGLNLLEKQKIADFIHGGLDYGESYGKQAGLYDISADHIGFAVNHAALKGYLVDQNYMEDKDSESMTNIEYRSEPFEERDPCSQAKVDRAAAEIKAHAVDAAGKATSGQRKYLQAPVSNFYTGVPVTELNKLLNGDAPGLALVQEMVAAINPRIYLQTTTGTLPSEIPALFTEAAADMRLADITSVRAGLLENAVLKAQQAVTANLGSVLMRGFNPGEIASLKGWMTLVAQYLLAYQLETSSYRFRVDGADGGKIKAGGSTAKNLVAYLSKTHLADTIDALPARARPNVNGPRGADWIALFASLLRNTAKNRFNLIIALGLTDYEGQNYYDADGNNPAPIIHDEVLGEGQTPNVWMERLLTRSIDLAGDYEAFHVQTGNDLTLDDGQENESPPLTIKGEQAIPLEDRYHKFKHSSGDLTDISRADIVIGNEWSKATARRTASTAARTTFTTQLNTATAFLAGYGTAVGRVNTLLALRNEYNDIVADPDNVQAEQAKLNTLNLHIQQWQAVNSNAGVACALVSSLILDHRWSTKGSAFIGTKTPEGVVELRTVLSGNTTSAQKLVSLAQIAVNKIANPDDRRHATTTLLYQLLRDMNGMYTTGGAGWTNFIVRLTAVENGM